MSIKNLLSSIATINRHFIGGFRTQTARVSSKYYPHQGKQEMARRVRQMEKSNGNV